MNTSHLHHIYVKKKIGGISSPFCNFFFKEIESLHKLGFSNSVLATQCHKQTMNSVRSNNLSLKYQSFTTLGCKDVGVRKFEFVVKTQFLYVVNILFVTNTKNRFYIFIKMAELGMLTQYPPLINIFC